MRMVQKQTGMVLVISLIMLLLLSLLVISGLGDSWLQERMAGNLYQREQALLATEQRLIVALDVATDGRMADVNTDGLWRETLSWPRLDLADSSVALSGLRRVTQVSDPDDSAARGWMQLGVPLDLAACHEGFSPGWSRLETRSPDATTAPTLIDLDGDQVADLAYVGDTDGQVWRLGPDGQDTGKQLLFRALDATGQPQPITSAMTVVRHPTGVGQLLLFGTGRLETGDVSDAQQQSLYVIWDRGEVFPGLLDRADLLARQWLNPQGSDRFIAREARFDETLDWHQHRGWFIDWPLSAAAAGAERVINPVQRCGPLLLVLSVAPELCCPVTGSRWVNLFRIADGGPPDWPVADLNADGLIDAQDFENPDGLGLTSPVSYWLRSDQGLQLIDEGQIEASGATLRSLRLQPMPTAARSTWHQ